VTWLGRLLRGRRLERELDAELSDHLARQVADYVAAGVSEADARRRARLEFGGLEQTKEHCRDARGTRLVDDLVQDLRYGLRVLRRSPAFTAVAVASLALGIGANTAIFTLVDALVLRSLPVPEPARLVRLAGGSWTNAIWEAIRDRDRQLGFEAAAFSETRFDLAAGGEADLAQGLFASGAFFEVMGVPALLGRTLTPADDQRGGGAEGPVAVISHAFWQRRFGGAASAVGGTLSLNGVAFTVVGVASPGFFGPSVGRSFDVAVPIGTVDLVQGRAGGRGWLDERSTWWLDVLARLEPGRSVAEATAALRAAQPQVREAALPGGWAAEDLAQFLGEPLSLVPAASGFSDLRREYERPLLAVMAVVALVLLVACANLASLLLARASARRHELGARLALGAGQWRLARQLLTESLLLAVPGSLLGLLFARAGSALLVAQLTSRQGLVSLDVSLHWRVLLFTSGVTLATVLLFGVAPALRARRLSPSAAIRPGARGVLGAGPRAIGRPLVVVQVALSLVLVFAAGLFLRTFVRLAHRDLGFDRGPLLLVNLDAQRSEASAAGGRGALFARAREAAAAVPGVAEAAVSAIPPVSGMGWNGPVELEGGIPRAGRERFSWYNAVSPGYFRSYGTPLLAGRDFDERDRLGAPAVAIVNEAFARRFCGCPSPLGLRALRHGPPGVTLPPVEVVGVVKDAAYRSLREAMAPTLYVPMAQLEPDAVWPFATLAVRSAAGPPQQHVRPLTRALQAVDPRLSLTFQPLAAQLDAVLMRERMVAMLSGFFGVLAVLLAGIGLYGVTAYAVSSRRSEIGLRMALGADAHGVVRLVLRGVMLLVALGLAIGAAASLWASRFAGSLLYELEPHDPVTLAGSALVLVAASLLAAGLPARDAVRIDPAEVLRES